MAGSHLMLKYKVILLVVVFLVGVGALVYAWVDLPRRTVQAFAGDLYHQRYQEAAGMLRPPSALGLDSDGGLILVDRTGRSIVVPGAKLPFKVAGGGGGPEHDLKMMALGPSTNGILDSTPVTLYLSGAGGKVTIEAVD